MNLFDYLVRPEGFEPPTPRFEVWCSIQLSYGRLCGQYSQCSLKGKLRHSQAARSGRANAARHARETQPLDFFREDGLPNRFVLTRVKRLGNPQGTWSLDRGERNNESKIGKNYLLRSKYPQSKDHAIAAFRGKDVAPECRFIYDPF
jgi:hypothetical protein